MNQLENYLRTFKSNLDLVSQYQNLEEYQHPNFESQINKKTKVHIFYSMISKMVIQKYVLRD